MKRSDTAWGVIAREPQGTFSRANELTVSAGTDNGTTSYNSCLSKAHGDYDSRLRTANTFRNWSDQLAYGAIRDRIH